MPTLELVEYWAHTNSGYSASGNTLVFSPAPISLTKDVTVKWRIRRPGFQRKVERARFRYNEKIQFKASGSCNAEKRNEIEWYSKRDSLFKLQNCDMDTFLAEETSDTDENAYQYWIEAKGQAQAIVYLVFESAKFTQREGKIDWFDYVVTLRRVHLTRH